MVRTAGIQPQPSTPAGQHGAGPGTRPEHKPKRHSSCVTSPPVALGARVRIAQSRRKPPCAAALQKAAHCLGWPFSTAYGSPERCLDPPIGDAYG